MSQLQPKFKFGDKLKVISADKIITVESIYLNYNSFGKFVYNNTHYEAELELYVEPQKKKLLAFRDGAFISFAEEVGNITFERLTEYDIEYDD